MHDELVEVASHVQLKATIKAMPSSRLAMAMGIYFGFSLSLCVIYHSIIRVKTAQIYKKYIIYYNIVVYTRIISPLFY